MGGQGAAEIAWIGVDWGTSNLRAHAVSATGALLGTHSSDQGMSRLTPGEFEPALIALIAPWLAPSRCMPVLVCGMAGARQGWAEAPYRAVPCAPVMAGTLMAVGTRDPRLKVAIVPGLCQMAPPDVMRGEETQIAGFLAQNPGFEGAICLPGTHSKWVRIVAGSVVGFTTFMTGELFAVLCDHTVLRHSLATAGLDEAAFAQAAHEAAMDPARLGRDLFGLRAQALLADLAPEAARARLSGLLIGHELGLARGYWERAAVALIGSDAVVAPYRAALGALGCTSVAGAPDALALAGLALAAQMTRESDHA